MSLQQSEARADRLREIAAADVAPPSRGAINLRAARDAHKARVRDADARKRQAEARRVAEVAEAIALGVEVVAKTAVNTSWTEAEDAAVATLYPHYGQMHAKLPHRSRRSLESRASFLGLIPPQKLWTAKEVETLRRLWASATTSELAGALPRWPLASINSKATKLGLPPRGAAPLLLTGNALCDAIRDRCRVLGYPASYLDRIARTGTYFQGREWKAKAGHRQTPMIRAVSALGGTLNVEWPD